MSFRLKKFGFGGFAWRIWRVGPLVRKAGFLSLRAMAWFWMVSLGGFGFQELSLELGGLCSSTVFGGLCSSTVFGGLCSSAVFGALS